MTRSVLASADAATSCKLLALKMGVVMIGSCLDNYEAVQVVLVLLAIVGITMYLFYDVSAGCGRPYLACSLLASGGLLLHCLCLLNLQRAASALSSASIQKPSVHAAVGAVLQGCCKRDREWPVGWFAFGSCTAERPAFQ